jgi:hypothetical protein
VCVKCRTKGEGDDANLRFQSDTSSVRPQIGTIKMGWSALPTGFDKEASHWRNAGGRKNERDIFLKR